VSTNATVDAALIASIAEDKPYNKTTEFLLDLNHEKNRLESKPNRIIDSV